MPHCDWIFTVHKNKLEIGFGEMKRVSDASALLMQAAVASLKCVVLGNVLRWYGFAVLLGGQNFQ